MSVAGVDGCRGGWLAVLATVHDGRGLCVQDVVICGSFGQLLDLTGACSAVSIDIPIGLSDDGRRAADFQARRMIGRRRSSVFPPPARALVGCCDYASANALSRRISGRGFSRQSFNILDKIRDADGGITPSLQRRVVESHPEVSFCALNAGACLQHTKRSVAGREERCRLLSGIFDDFARLRPPQGAAWDDLYDACVLAWTAARLAAGCESHLPAQPEFDPRGLRMEIVY
jgi:predicted RNase H-like nuclease